MTRPSLAGDDVLRRAYAIGDYYGFQPFSVLAEANKARRVRGGEEMPTLPPLDTIAETVASFLKQCRDAGLAPSAQQPIFVWHTNIASGRPTPKTAVVQFHAIGSDRPIAEAVVIRAMRALTHDLAKSEPTLRINTLGDKETRARFARELGNFFRKRSATLSPACIDCAKRDVFEAAKMALTEASGDTLPSATDFLSDQSRKRFEELLEYLEATDTPYELASDLISHGGIWSETCFEINAGEDVHAWGSRYGDLARAFFKTSMPSAGAVLKVETVGGKIPAMKGRGKMRFAFVHIGEEAKHASIKLAEELRRARLPLWQIIGLESLTEQMIFVEKMNPPYLLIMGRKEALEHSAVLRNRATQEEEIIPLIGLTERLKAFA